MRLALTYRPSLCAPVPNKQLIVREQIAQEACLGRSYYDTVAIMAVSPEYFISYLTIPRQFISQFCSKSFRIT